MSIRLVKAEACARFAHQAMGQRRKYNGEDYYKHPWRVVLLLKRAFTELNVDFEVAESYLCAAALHDVIEDTQVTSNDIQEEHGLSVRIIVDAMTYDKTGSESRFVKKRKYFLEIADSTDDGLILLKLADVRDNIESIIKNDPGFANIFCKEVEFFLEAIDSKFTKRYGTSKIHQSFLYKELREILNTKQYQLEK